MERRAELWTAGKGIATTLKAKSAEAAKRQNLEAVDAVGVGAAEC